MTGALVWKTGTLEGQLYAFNPDGTLYATVLPSLLHGVVASVGGQRLWYPAERFAFWELDSQYEAVS